jgi:hypothetical protein
MVPRPVYPKRADLGDVRAPESLLNRKLLRDGQGICSRHSCCPPALQEAPPSALLPTFYDQ